MVTCVQKWTHVTISTSPVSLDTGPNPKPPNEYELLFISERLWPFNIYLFIQYEYFWSIDAFSFNMHFFCSTSTFSIMAHFRLIDIFWHIQFEWLWHFNKHLLVYILQLILHILIYTTQTKLETQHCFFFLYKTHLVAIPVRHTG